MKSLLLQTDAWDLALDSAGNIAVADVPYSIAQDVACAIRTFQSECYYDTTLGVPYWQEVLAKTPPPPLALLKARIVQAAMSVTGVANAVCYITGFSGRGLSGTVQFTDTNGVTQTVSL